MIKGPYGSNANITTDIQTDSGHFSLLHQLKGKGEPATRTTDGRNRLGASTDEEKKRGPKEPSAYAKDNVKGILNSSASCPSCCAYHFPSRLRKIEVYLDEAL